MTNPQESLFDRLHEKYGEHYDDSESQNYRIDLFLSEIAQLIREQVPPDGAVLEIASGTGVNLSILKDLVGHQNNIEWWGNDISTEMQAAFVRNHGSQFLVSGDMTQQSVNVPKLFDLILIIGGVHHMTNDLDGLFGNIKRFIAPAGLLVFVEPNALFLDSIRKLWYRFDSRFDSINESAINPFAIYEMYGSSFKSERITFFGGPGFFLVQNSMILGIPKIVKRLFSKSLTRFDLWFSQFQFERGLPAFFTVWRNQQEEPITRLNNATIE